MKALSIQTFRRFSMMTLMAVFILIAVGGVVRSSGSGMGCPDWPTCFGLIIPPTSVNELPNNYKEKYVQYRQQKNEKFARYLTFFGMGEIAHQIKTDQSIAVETEFNPINTWIEYVNRLVGVCIGLLMILQVVFGVSLWKVNPLITRISILNLVLTIFQGWFGSIVVSTNLTSWTITVHMLLALVIVALLVYLIAHVDPFTPPVVLPTSTRVFILMGVLILLIQIILGTNVRQSLEAASLTLPRSEWIQFSGNTFIRHRTTSWLLMIIFACIHWNFSTHKIQRAPLKWGTFLLLISLVSGVIMSYFSVPAFCQPIHLVVASVVFALLLMMYWNSSFIKVATSK